MGPSVLKSIASRDNPQFKVMAKLVTSSSERRRSGRSVLDGAHLLAAYLDSGGRPEAIMVNAAGAEDAEIGRLLARAAPAKATLVSDSLFSQLSTVDSPTGVVASVATPSPRAVPASAGFVLLLEDIQDPGNVGALLRSAAAAGVEHALLSPHCAFAWSPKVLRAGMGAHFALNVVEGADLGTFLASFRGTSIALDASGESSLYDLDLAKRCAIVVGNEGAGVSAALLEKVKVRARIPMPGRVESLNAAAAGAVAVFEAVRQRTTKRL
jgi:TrmH family RNA methyltransferase